MPTSNVNNIVKGVVNGMGFSQHDSVPCNNATFPIAEGDLVYWDSSAHLVKKLDTDAHAATLLGVALKPSAVSSTIDSSSEPDVSVGYGCIASFFTTAGETYNHGDLVYIGADAQTILNTTGPNVNPVGCIQLKSGQAAVTGAAGVKIQVRVYSRAFVKSAN